MLSLRLSRPGAARCVAALRRLAIAGAMLVSGLAGAEYPSRPIDLYIGSAPSGSTDALGRVLARSLQRSLGQPVVVHNTPGAGGAVMATQLLRSAPDGYSIGMTISHAYSGNPLVMPETTRYRVGDFTHLAAVSQGQCALVTSSAKPYRSFGELLDAARRGEQPVFASQSPLTRIVVDYIAKVADAPFKVITVQGGGEIMQTILGGHADFGFSGGPHVDFVAAGQMRVLASTEESRLASSPSAPTLQELGFDIASCAMFVVSAPPKLPADVKQALADALHRAIESPEMKSLIRSLKYPEHYLGPDEVTRALEREAETIRRAVARIDAEDGRGASRIPSTFMCYFAAALSLGALALLLLARWRRIDYRQSTAVPARSWLYICTASAVLAIAFAATQVFGYLIGGAVMVGGFMALARADLKMLVGTAVALPVSLWLLFEKLLGFPLP